MYIRRISRKNKNGSVTSYVQLAHNERNPKTGNPQAKVLYHFGREDEVDMDGLKRLAASISRFLGDEPVASEPKDSVQLSLLDSKTFGTAYIVDSLWHELGVGQAISKRLAQRKYEAPIERAIFAMVANRALDPSSKLGMEDWVKRDIALPGVENFEVHQGYRAMDFLIESDVDIQREVFETVADLLNLEVDLLFFDTTSSYFEMDDEPEEDSLKQPGYSKDHRPDLPQVVIGFAVTRDGIPVRCWVWPGNTSDMTVIPEVKKDLIGWRLGRVVTVVDRGFSSEDNLRELQKAGGHYIAGEKMTSGKQTVEDAMSRPGRFKTIRDNLEIKEIVVGDGEARVRYVLVRNPDEARRDAFRREAHLKALEAELARLKELDNDAHTKAHCRLQSHPTFKRYLKSDKRGNLTVDHQAVKAMERLDGKYLIRTSDDTLSAEDVALGYKQLWQVEAAFRSLKQTMELRPMYHRKNERIRAHVLLCWLSLLLVRVAENRTSHTWREIRSVMNEMHLVTYKAGSGRVRQRTEVTPEQAQILKALGYEHPPLFSDISTDTL
ncbi:IS1634 family transposase [Alicyclobacillus fastidiosus]|uniref:IS1634 family transposase n=1 Tax=Alicyclobacillus fastidiosus TaxID=392011 RepID=A0ABY6ZEJ2_9BACL|nr:IS1634 family transposase [Alicyclobacillus fastidiosus]WAH41259.1 IS1634 family transposase [Alicyclobacillus fastidiosus]GMA62854.1 transposase [Alicyclobacillus fastidiosus]GMA66079.1 transposase [Alicyclobacillus fastidiosus]